jgi:N-carbamoylputrescine amidase
MSAERTLRICSLLPSATEIVAALGQLDRLVGRSAECDFPYSVSGLPVVSTARVATADLSSAAIDAAVRAALVDGRSLYAVDADLVARLAPNLILTQDLCAVCAVSSRDETLCALGIETLALDAHSLRGIEQSILALSRRLGVPARGRAVVEAMEAKIGATRALVRGLAPRRVFVSEWLEPPFAAGHWLPEMVEAAGGVDLLGEAEQPSFRTSWEVVRRLEPELVVLACCGFDLERTVVEASRVALSELDCSVVAVDANAYYSRPAPRVADGVRQLAHLFHPKQVPDPKLPSCRLMTPAQARRVRAAHGSSPPTVSIERRGAQMNRGVRILRIGFLHLAPLLGAVEDNRSLIEEGTRVAAGLGVDWVISGELVVPGYRFAPLIGTDWIAEQPDPWMRGYMHLCSALDLVSFLSHPERARASGRLFNSLFAIGRNGQILGKHRKLSPTPGSEDWSSAGQPSPPIPVDGINVGLLICADVYAPTPAMQLREAGAQLLVSSAAWWPGEWGPNGEWEARSLETGLPMIVCNRTGADNETQLREAESIVVDRGERRLSLRSDESRIFIVDCRLEQGRIAGCEIAAAIDLALT